MNLFKSELLDVLVALRIARQDIITREPQEPSDIQQNKRYKKLESKIMKIIKGE